MWRKEEADAIEREIKHREDEMSSKNGCGIAKEDEKQRRINKKKRR
jgi:hypothetical protein